MLRVAQGVGSGCLQTANYAIISMLYPEFLDFAIGWLEAGAGVGLAFGPIIGVLIYNLGGFTLPFFFFSLAFLSY